MTVADIEQSLQLALHYHGSAGRLADAEAIYHRLLRFQPDRPDVLHLLGLASHARGRSAEAENYIRRAIALHPDSAAMHNNLGEVLRAMSRLGEARGCYEAAIELDPKYPEAQNNLGAVLAAMGETEQAAERFRLALRLRFDYANAWRNLAGACNALKQYDAAERAYRQYVRLRPDDATELAALGALLVHQRRHEQAHDFLARAVKLDSTLASAWCDLGEVYKTLDRVPEMTMARRRAVELAPDQPGYHVNLAMALLEQGQFAEGWAEHRWLWETDYYRSFRERTVRRDFDQNDIAGKTVYVLCNEGVGDVIQFSRYLPMLARCGAKVILACQPAAMSLLATVDGVSQVMPLEADLLAADVHVPLMALPRIFGTTLETIPSATPSVRAQPVAIARWKRRLDERGANRPLRVGLVWAGNPQHYLDQQRSCPLEDLTPLAGVSGVRFYSLQKGPAAHASQAQQTLSMIDLAPELNDFADTAALLENLDLLISVDTSAAHLAGALGRPVWTLLPKSADWRWLRDRQDSPWYPTMRLFRQTTAGDWRSVVERVAANLRTLAAPRLSA